MRSNKQSGFSLVEIAVVIMIIGLLTAGAMSMMKPYLEMSQANLTKKKLENISLALAMFAQNYGRLPCPADPQLAEGNILYGTPRNSGPDGDRVAENNCGVGDALHYGIIPFRALGLDEDQARDNYGNMITYTVSRAMTNYNSTNSAGEIHNMCRKDRIWVDGSNKNLVKARVCCPVGNPNQDIEINTRRVGGNPIIVLDHQDDRGDPNAAIGGVIAATNRLIAFALISHGPNGDGAFIEHTNNVKEVTAPNTAEESENRDNNDRELVVAPFSRSNNNDYYDDIIVWKTNDQLISAFGNDSCARP